MTRGPVTCWQVLGIARTRDRGDIRRAYAARLKITNPEDDAAGFQALRAAYEQALAHAARVQPPPGIFHSPAPTPASAVPDPPHSALPVTAPEPAAAPRYREPPADEPAHDPRAVEMAAHMAARQRLVDLLAPDARADADALEAALDAVVRSDAMAILDVRDQTEGWVSWVVAHAAPRSDALLVPAIHHFGWSSRKLDRRTPQPVYQVLARANSLAAISEMKKKGAPEHRAWKMLSAPPRPIGLLRRLFGPAPESIKRLLQTIRGNYSVLRVDFHPETVAQWEAFFQRPRLHPMVLWGLIAAVPCALLAIFLVLNAGPAVTGPDGETTYPTLAALYPAMVPVAAVAVLLWHYGVEWPRHMWRTRGADLHGRFWPTLGWAPAALATLALSTVPVPWLGGAGAVLSILVVLWAATTGEADRRPSGTPWLLRGLQAYAVPLVWLAAIGFLLSRAGGIQTAVAAVAAVVTFLMGKMSLHRLWADLDRKRQSAAIIIAACLCVACGALCIVGLPTSIEPGWSASRLGPPTVALVTTIVLCCRVPVLDNTGLDLRFVVLRLMCFGGFIAISIAVPFLGGIAVLAWGLYCLTRAWQEHRRPMPRPTLNL